MLQKLFQRCRCTVPLYLEERFRKRRFAVFQSVDSSRMTTIFDPAEAV